MSAAAHAVLSVVVRRRWSRFAGVVALVATLGSAAVAFQIDPEILTQVRTPATGLWIPAPVTGEIVRIDAGSGDVTARVNVGEPGAELVLAEREHGVIVVDRTAGRVSLVDPGVHEVVRSVGSVVATEAMVDIGPDGIVASSLDEVALVDLDVTESTIVAVPPTTRSAAAAGDGALVENGVSRLKITADGAAGAGDASGQFVRVNGNVVVVSADGVRSSGGSKLACFDGIVVNPDHVVSGVVGWVIAVQGRTVHTADLENGECTATRLPDGVGPIGRPVVADFRVYVPEQNTGVVHIVDPSRRTSVAHSALPAGDVHLRVRGDFVAAYDSVNPLAALLDRDGIVHFVDTSFDERGIATVIDEEGTAAVVGGEGEGGAIDGTGTEGVSTGVDAPVIDASVLAATLQNPADEADNALPDDALVANFAFSATTVVVGEAVRFVDGSTGAPQAWLWDFGDGTGAEGPEVEKAWSEPGTYPVTLRITRGEDNAEISLAITVVPAEVALPPAADFVFSAAVVSVGQPIAFEDRSDGEITRWRWNFGDGTSATAPNVEKAWSEPGRYLVQLTVANEQGSHSASVFIEVVEGLRAPVAVLTVEKTEVDLGAPLAFGGSSSTDPASYSWDFGDGRTSSGADVVHVFLSEGTFTVTLTAENAAGESTESIDIVVVPPTQPPIAAIGTLPGVIEVGDVVALSSLSTNSPDTEVWTFGDGETATGARVTHTWASEGTYLLSLTATNAAGTNTATETVVIVAELPAPVAQIGDYNESPWVGDTTVFIDASIDATAWLWDFGDGVTSTSPNPLHTFATPGQKIVTLTVSNRNGVNSTSVVVEPRLEPIASFFVSSSAIRAGDTVNFIDDSVNAVSWFWDFGDDTTSGAQNPIHTYTETGSFGVLLTATSATGDTDDFGPVIITVDPAAPRLSGILKLPVDDGDITTLTTSAFAAVVDPESGPIDQYEIEFGDGSAPEQNATGTFSHVYGASGSYVVSVRARGPLGDFSEPVTRSFDVVDPPAPRVGISAPATAEVGTVALKGVVLAGSGPISSWRWEITRGPNSWEYSSQNVNHTFEAAGKYRIRLTAESPVPALPDDEATVEITITVPPAPVITNLTAAPSPATTEVPVTFTPTVTGSVATWEWDYDGNGYVLGAEIGQHFFNVAGDHQVKLRVTGPFGQQDTATVDVTVHPRPDPTAPVPTPSDTVATGTNVTLTSSAGGLPGLRWDWEITDGNTTIERSDVGPSIDHLFDTAGSWTVTVTATDALDISGTNFVFVTVLDPDPLVASFTFGPTATAQQIQFDGSASGPPVTSWQWDFDDPGAVGDSSAEDPLVTFSAPGAYNVRLTVTSGAEVAEFSLLVNVL